MLLFGIVALISRRTGDAPDVCNDDNYAAYTVADDNEAIFDIDKLCTDSCPNRSVKLNPEQGILLRGNVLTACEHPSCGTGEGVDLPGMFIINSSRYEWNGL